MIYDIIMSFDSLETFSVEVEREYNDWCTEINKKVYFPWFTEIRKKCIFYLFLTHIEQTRPVKAYAKDDVRMSV